MLSDPPTAWDACHKTTEVSLQTLVHYFGLVVHLQMEGGAPFQHGVLHSKQLRPEVTKDLGKS